MPPSRRRHWYSLKTGVTATQSLSLHDRAAKFILEFMEMPYENAGENLDLMAASGIEP